MSSFVAVLALAIAIPTIHGITPAIQQQAALRGIQSATGAQQQQDSSLFGAFTGLGFGHGLFNGFSGFGYKGLGFGYPYAADPTAQAAAASLLGAQPQAADPAAQAILKAVQQQQASSDSIFGGFPGFGLKGLGLRGLGFRGLGFKGFGLNRFPHAADPTTQAILRLRAVQQQAADPATQAILRAVQQQAGDPAATSILGAVQQQQASSDFFLGGLYGRFGFGLGGRIGLPRFGGY